MELNDLIPDKSSNWLVRKKQLIFVSLVNLPMCYIDNEIVYVYLDNNNLHKPTLKLVSHLIKLKVEFYFLPPSFSHPAAIKYENHVISHYFTSYSNEKYFYGFDKIGFDLIRNLVKWCQKENCIPLIKECYDSVNKKIQRPWYDYYQRKDVYEYDQNIREEFKSLFRQIQINQIL
jgi:hypothetical protein